MTKIEIVEAGLEDLPLLVEWRMQVLREVFSMERDADLSLLEKQNEAYYKKHLADGSHIACFARDQDSHEIIGCGSICYQKELPSPDNPSGTNGYLMNIYTLPKARTHGIGRKIIEYLIEDARKKGTEKIYLESSKVAKKLYNQIGFTDLEDYMKL